MFAFLSITLREQIIEKLSLFINSGTNWPNQAHEWKIYLVMKRPTQGMKRPESGYGTEKPLGPKRPCWVRNDLGTNRPVYGTFCTIRPSATFTTACLDYESFRGYVNTWAPKPIHTTVIERAPFLMPSSSSSFVLCTDSLSATSTYH